MPGETPTNEKPKTSGEKPEEPEFMKGWSEGMKEEYARRKESEELSPRWTEEMREDYAKRMAESKEYDELSAAGRYKEALEWEKKHWGGQKPEAIPGTRPTTPQAPNEISKASAFKDTRDSAMRRMGELTGKGAEITDEELNSVQLGKASPFDPDFILIFFLALIADLAIDPLMETVGAVLTAGATLIISRIIDVITFILIGGWIYWKSKQFVMPEAMAQRMKKMEANVMAKIQAQISKKVASKALRKALIRVIPALGIEMIPGIAVFTSWIAAVISMVL